MKTIHSFTFDQHIKINNISGYVDFIGEEVIILITENNQRKQVNVQDIKEVYSLGGENNKWIQYQLK